MDDDTDDGFFNDIEDDYYTFLNVDKNATSEEINAAYRTLSRSYHPDKHVDVNLKQKAELLFNRTKKAYEVLSDPHKRAIYDSLGIKGLQTEGWEIVHRTKTPQEIREEYERLARDQEERRMQQRTNPKGNITVNINATEIFNAYDDEFEESGFPTIEVSGMSISQSIDAPITNKDTITMSGNLSSQNGVGNGGFLITGRRLINKGWIGVDVGAGNGPVMGFKAFRTLTQRFFCNGGATLNFRQDGIIPGLVGTLAFQMDKHTVGYLTYNGGIQSTMSTVIEHNTEEKHVMLTVTVGVPHCFISASYTKRLIEHELKLRAAAKVGTFGFITECGAEKKVSKYSSVLASVSIGVPTGVILKLKVIRSSQSYIFPIHLSEEIVPAAIFYATLTPILMWFVLKKTIIEPMNAEQKQRKLEKLKETNKQRMAEKRQEAEAAIDLLLFQYERICEEETKRKGLIILSAKYGKINVPADTTSEENSNDDIVIDVTIPLQCLIKNSKLRLREASKSQLPGFYDPCFGEEKKLKIEYTFQDRNYVAVVGDTEVMELPIVSSQ